MPSVPSSNLIEVPLLAGEPCLKGLNLPQHVTAVLNPLITQARTNSSTLKIAVALSGGADSLALSHALWRCLQVVPGFTLRAIHINHGLHHAARQWQEQVEAQCRAWGLALDTRPVEVHIQGQGLEAAARESRYQAFEALLSPGELLLTAHHQDDQAETVLLSLLRGAGLRGLAGIAEERLLGTTRLLRPLLEWPGALLKQYCQFHHLAVVEDPSNENHQLRRNFLRHQVMPLLRQHWPDASAQLARSARLLRDYEEHFEDEEKAWLRTHHDALASTTANIAGIAQSLSWNALAHQPAIQRRRLFLAWLRHWRAPPVPARRLDEFLKQLETAGSLRSPCLKWVGWQVQRYQGQLYLLSPGFLSATAPEQTLVWRCGEAKNIRHPWWGELGLSADSAAAPEITGPDPELSVAWRAAGQRLMMPDGHHQTVKKLLQQCGLPPFLRSRIPLLYCGDELWALGDLRLAPDCLRWLQRRGMRLVWRAPPLIEH